MSARFQVLLVLTFGMLLGCPTHAGDTGLPKCGSWPEPFAANQPYVFKDPRSGLMLYVESDNRHMAAITRDGRLLWHRNLFEGLKGAPPPYQLPDEPPISTAEGQKRVRAYLARLTIDSIGPVPDCAMNGIDHDRAPPFHGYYIRAGSGTHMTYLLDANTGDIVVDMIN